MVALTTMVTAQALHAASVGDENREERDPLTMDALRTLANKSTKLVLKLRKQRKAVAASAGQE